MSYAVSLDIRGRVCLVVGAGRVAQRKIEGLMDAGGHVRVVGIAVQEKIEQWSRSGKIELHKRRFEDGDLAGCWLAIAATDDTKLNDHVGQSARKQRILFSSATGTGDFTSPAVLKKGLLNVAVSTEAASPSYARFLCDYLDKHLVDDHAEMLEMLLQIRRRLKEIHPHESENRQQMMRQMVPSTIVSDIQCGKFEHVKKWIFECQSLPQD